MALLSHVLAGHTIVPLDARIGFGLPTTPFGQIPTGPSLMSTPGDPNGVLAAPLNSIAMQDGGGTVWRNADGATTWVPLGGGGGGEDLAATLVLGNTTGGNDLVVSTGDEIVGQTDVTLRSTGVGTNINLIPDAAGAVLVTGRLSASEALALVDPGAGTSLYVESADGQTAPVSPANRARIRYNDALAQWEQSISGAAYIPFGGGGGGEDLAATLVIGNITGGTDIVVSVGDEIRGPNTLNDDGLRFLDVGTAVPSLAYGNVTLVAAQFGWLVGGENVVVNRASDLGGGPSILWAEDLTLPANALVYWSELLGLGHTIGANAYLESVNLNGNAFVINPGVYVAYSYINGTFGTLTSSVEYCLVTMNSGTIDDAQRSLLALNGSHVVTATDAVVVGSFHRYESPGGGSAFGGGTWVNNRAMYAWAGNHSAGTTPGQYQMGMGSLARETTTAAVATMSCFTATSGAINWVLRPNSTETFRLLVTARQTAGAAGAVGDSASWEYSGSIRRDGAGNTTLIYVRCQQLRDLALNGGGNVLAHVGIDASAGTMTPTGNVGASGAWLVQVDADDATEALRVQVTGELNKTIRWEAQLLFAEAGAGTAI